MLNPSRRTVLTAVARGVAAVAVGRAIPAFALPERASFDAKAFVADLRAMGARLYPMQGRRFCINLQNAYGDPFAVIAAHGPIKGDAIGAVFDALADESRRNGGGNV